MNPQNTELAIYKSFDIDSTYRNRNQYQNPASFVIPINFSARTSNNSTSIDAVASAVPYSGSTISSPGNLFIGVGSTTTIIVLDSTESIIPNFYVNSFLEVSGEFRNILSYDSTTNRVVVDLPFSIAPVLGQVYYTRKSIPFFVGSIDSSSPPTNSTFSFDSTASIVSESYTNSIVRFTSGANQGLTSRITSYSGFTRIITVATPFPNSVVVGDTLELISVTRDNASTLFYVGNKNKAIYEVELSWLSMPIQTLTVGYGGTVVNYPYLYVKLYNDGNQLSSQVFYSNNPNSVNAIFKVPVNEYFGVEQQQFVTLKDSKSLQTISLNPDQDLRFEVCLPDGQVVKFVTPDNLSPSAPNPFVQINALFSLRKISNLS